MTACCRHEHHRHVQGSKTHLHQIHIQALPVIPSRASQRPLCTDGTIHCGFTCIYALGVYKSFLIPQSCQSRHLLCCESCHVHVTCQSRDSARPYSTSQSPPRPSANYEAVIPDVARVSGCFTVNVSTPCFPLSERLAYDGGTWMTVDGRRRNGSNRRETTRKLEHRRTVGA